MTNNIVMRIARYILIICLTNVHGAITCLAAPLAIWPFVSIKHQVPYNDALAPIVDGAQCNFTHILHQTFFKIASIIPFSNGCFRKYQFLVWALIMNIDKFSFIPTIIMVRRSGEE